MKGIDEKLADRLNEVKSSAGVDSDALWSGISSELDSGGGFFTWGKGLGVLAFLLGIGGAVYFTHSDTQQDDTTKFSDHTEATGQYVESSEAETTSIRYHGESAVISTLSEEELVNEASIKASSSEQSVTVTNQSFQTTAKSNEAARSANATEYESMGSALNKEENTSFSQAIQKGTESSDAQEASKVLLDNEVSAGNYEATGGLNDNVENLNAISNSSTQSFKTNEGLGDALTTETSALAASDGSGQLAYLEMLQMTSIQIGRDQNSFGGLTDVGQADYFRDKTLWPSELVMMSGISYWNTSIETDNTESQDLNSLFTSRSGYSFGLGAMWHIEQNFRVQLGVRQEVLKQRFNYIEEQSTEVLQDDHIVDLQVDSLGNVTPVYGNHVQSALSTRTIEHYNTYKLISIPLLVGYEEDLGQVTVGMYAGVEYNLVTKQSGRGLDPEGALVEITDNQGLLAQNFISYTLMPTISFELDKRWELAAMPCWSMSTSRPSTTEGISSDLQRYRLDVGLAYRLR